MKTKQQLIEKQLEESSEQGGKLSNIFSQLPEL